MEDKVLIKIINFFSTYKSQNFKKGEVLIRAYETSNNIFYLEEGWIKMYSITKNGDELVLNVFKPNSFFPVSLAVNNNENKYFYESMTPIKIRIAPDKKAVDFIKSNPDVLFNLLQRVYKGLDGILLKMEYAMSNDAKSRLILELIIQAKRSGENNKNTYSLNISVSDLALNVGLARETVSRELKLLKEKKLISVNNKKLTIIDLEKLESEIS